MHTRYVHCVLLAGLLTTGCEKPSSTNAPQGSADRAAAQNSGTVEIPARTHFYVRVDKTLDSAKAKQGDLVKGTLDSPIVAGGKEILPRGTDLGIRVTNAQLASAPGTVGLLTLDVETIHHGGAEYRIKASPVTVETAPVKEQVDPNKQLPNLPLTEKQGRANAVLDSDRAVLFELIEPVSIKP